MTTRFGDLFRKTREDTGKSMGDVARYLGITVPYVSDVERNIRGPFTPDKILRAAQFLGAPAEPLLRAAVEHRGAIEIDVTNASDRAKEVGAALMRGWQDLDPEALEKIAAILGKEGTKK